MRVLPQLFEANRAWARAHEAEDPDFFRRLSEGQAPGYLWIGCADSRVPANQIVGLAPGELFVHRNVANLVPEADDNGMSVLQYAVDALQVGHVIVCGHYGCGGVRAALDESGTGHLERWLAGLRKIRDANSAELEALEDDGARWARLCELNVEAQVDSIRRSDVVREAWERGQSLAVHGWIYGLEDGLLHDLDVTVTGAS